MSPPVEPHSDGLGMVIENVEREQSPGSFIVDLVGDDGAGNAGVVENRLERSGSRSS